MFNFNLRFLVVVAVVFALCNLDAEKGKVKKTSHVPFMLTAIIVSCFGLFIRIVVVFLPLIFFRY